MSSNAFSQLNLIPELISNLESLAFNQMTPIQAQSLPPIILGKDVIAQAKTGSGKTAAFGLGILNKLKVKQFRVQTLVLCPTRELADQVAKEIRRLARAIHNIKVLTICGGMPFGPQIGSLEHGAHIVVGTPGRIEEHVRKGNLNFDHLTTLVLDEADRMLEMGFKPALESIIAAMPRQRQTLLFSATFPKEIQAIAKQVMQQPQMVEAQETHNHTSIEQHFYLVSDFAERVAAVRLLLMKFLPTSAVVFCNTKKEVQELTMQLCDQGIYAVALHGDLDQKDRDQTLVRFANQSVNVLVATDVAARGLDIKSLDAVINVGMAHDSEVHVHRIGRTGRAGEKGIACSLVLEKEKFKIKRLEDYLQQTISFEALPDRSVLRGQLPTPRMLTLQIDGGKKQKVRPGDILGALTGENGIDGNNVGKIQIFPNTAYVAVATQVAKQALKKLSQGKLKGRSFKVRQVT
ncbi:ATP-dependent RNA helicase DbpA [Aliikangiella sp. IMCC44653]